MLTRHQVADLERDFRAGYGPSQAAKRRNFSAKTVSGYYDEFVLAGVPRGSRKGNIITAVYRGPDWIGERIVERRVPRGHIDILPASDDVGAPV